MEECKNENETPDKGQKRKPEQPFRVPQVPNIIFVGPIWPPTLALRAQDGQNNRPTRLDLRPTNRESAHASSIPTPAYSWTLAKGAVANHSIKPNY